ncbi:hypothetical protein Pfo_008639 [Paulownia fortunei]|nr:hypothetical protein Pfo_008639 [Paulownia fortunei]
MKNFGFFFLFLLISSVFLATEGRLLYASEAQSPLFYRPDAVPSPGEGHKLINAPTLGGIKGSRRSPGEGHSHANSETFGDIKRSGPSPGAGH